VQGCKRVAIIAHSMGNRILTAALDGVRDAEATAIQLLRTATLVFAAADVGRRDFVRVLKTTAARPADKRLRTVYRSSCDRALALSTFINATGRVGCRLLLEDDFETVDASQSSGRDFTKHGYWAQSKAVVADLRGLIILGRAAPERVLRVDNADGTLKHCSCHPVTATRRHYVIHRP
jgi:esterase/lipase superfamily enzyme